MVWDGRRPLSERRRLSHRALGAQGMGFNFVTESIAAPTDWCIEEDHHTLVLHMAGGFRGMESVFANGPSARVLPDVGDFWVIPAGQRYAALAEGETVGYCEMTVPTALIADRALPPRIGHRDPFLQGMIERLAVVAGRVDDLAQMLRDTLAELIRLHLLDRSREPMPGGQGGGPVPRALLGLLDELRETLDWPHSLDTMAARAGMARGDFLRAFHAATGMTPHRWLIGQRIALAKALLADRRRPITDIALAVGFSTPSHFSAAFRQHTGLSPSEHRQALLG